ncbi:uncharacterized protein N7496_010892 [Penicillium cataractarum]|uniref:Serine hydrolase domain-containing protein n=1 Tax=Penicillium cataractarum TaxID=2100454 RepID=A0A9W9UVV2_9EURO|nr:uncharacterized protein N7496_010892 [Penicillium cataractarum]KAJ5358479.1 hypothetical protein N7496_010892 [Penicillium cataractarum]
MPTFRSLLPDYYEWEFVDADHDCEAAEGVSQIYPGPYLSFYNTPYTKEVSKSHAFIDEMIEQDGPFDAIMGFSQGAAVAASYILKAQASDSLAPPPFRLAIFICSSLPFSTDPSAGFNITRLYETGGDMLTSDLAYWKSFAGAAPPTTIPHVNCGLNGTLSDAHLDPTDTVHRYHPLANTVANRIDIPTVHIYGRDDPYKGQSVALLGLCSSQQDLTYSYEHPGGHNVPTMETVSKNISNLIRKAVTRSELMF